MSNSTPSDKKNVSHNIGKPHANQITSYLKITNVDAPLQGDHVHNQEALNVSSLAKPSDVENLCHAQIVSVETQAAVVNHTNLSPNQVCTSGEQFNPMEAESAPPNANNPVVDKETSGV